MSLHLISHGLVDQEAGRGNLICPFWKQWPPTWTCICTTSKLKWMCFSGLRSWTRVIIVWRDITYPLCCSKLFQNLTVQNSKCYVAQFPIVRSLGESQQGWFWFKVSHEHAVKCLSRAAIICFLTGLERLSSLLLESWLLLAISQRPSTVGHFPSLLRVFMMCHMAFHTENDPELKEMWERILKGIKGGT